MKIGGEIQDLIKALGRIQGFGNRSAVRAAISLVSDRDGRLAALHDALSKVRETVRRCPICGAFDTQSPCSVCSDASRDGKVLCIVEDISDLWAMERGGIYNGRYHVLGGILSAIQGVTPDDINVATLKSRVVGEGVAEVILALPVTIDAKITAHYIAELIRDTGVRITELAHGVPIGGELNYLDEGTIEEALKGRRSV
ncbi:MAG: recombination mediator RecR [Rickettsiales bacterium]|jgi:recombination protein RecR|nr:recombination mediator RecR [Rickettsiales bacterium]